jgi:hypothetical protein
LLEAAAVLALTLAVVVQAVIALPLYLLQAELITQ